MNNKKNAIKIITKGLIISTLSVNTAYNVIESNAKTIQENKRFLKTNEIANIPDINLLKAINEALGKNDLTSFVTISELESLRRLDLIDKNIKCIDGLEHAINLVSLNLNNNNISDISSLKNLTNLTYLNINSNKISDISILKNLTNLTDLNISNNKISDISVLENFNKLNVLFMQNNKMLDYQISDISVLGNLTNLTHLNISYNKIRDISPLSNLTNLTRLNAESNLYSDLKPVENLTNLTWLEFHTTKVTDMDSIKNLTKLSALYTSSYVSDISVLENLNNLTILHLCNNKNILDISVLESLTKLKHLYINNNNISDISVLGNLTNLNTLEVNNNLISNISILKNLTNLNTLKISNNNILDISIIKNLTNLNRLEANNNQISDISSLSNLISLNNLSLYNNKISNISSLNNLVNLVYLNLYNNQISDISALRFLINLTELHLGSNHITDISSLENLTKLTRLELYCNKISDISILEGLTNLTVLNLGTLLVLEDISPLNNLTNLTILHLDNNKISDISPLINLTKLTDLKLGNQNISISRISEIGQNLSTVYINNPIKGINNEKIDITSISNNGYYQNGKLYWDNMSLGNYSFTINFSKTYNINGNNVVYNGKANINLEVVDGAGPSISNNSSINEEDLSIYVTINAEDLLSDVDYLIHNGEQYQLPYTFKYDIYNRNNNIVEVFDDLGNSSIYEVTANELSSDILNQYINLLESDNNSPSSLSYIRAIINSMDESSDKDLLSDRINNLPLNIELDKKTTTSNLDIYIKCENMLSMSLDTNQISFSDFSGIEDVEKLNAVNITINSSLPYQINAYLPSEIQNADKDKTLDKSILNIKESGEMDYKEFNNINDKVILKDNCSSGNQLVHGIDIMLKGGIAHEKDVYKAVIKLEVEQK